VHDSGAERALAADVAHDLGVEFAQLRDETLTAIGDLLDEGLVPTNPLDIWGTGADTRRLFGACLRVITEDPAVAVTALAVDLLTEFDGDTSYADAVLDVAKLTDAPLAVLASVPSAIDTPTAERLRTNGIPVLEGTRSGLAALGHLAHWPAPLDRTPALVQRERVQRWRAAESLDAFELLIDYGIAVVESRQAQSIGEARDAADAVGYPVALKTLGVVHKSDVGGVALDLADEAALSTVYAAMAESLGPAVSVQAIAPDGIEISVGFVRDDAFGSLVVVAAGGTLVELLADRAVACPPISHAGAMRLLDRLRVRQLLAGWRGAPAVDVSPLADVVVRFSQMAIELGDVLDAVEANPVVVSADGVVAVDALVIVRGGIGG
jgi:acyl-CoA synthetase (NDP forming)